MIYISDNIYTTLTPLLTFLFLHEQSRGQELINHKIILKTIVLLVGWQRCIGVFFQQSKDRFLPRKTLRGTRSAVRGYYETSERMDLKNNK